MYVCVCVCVCGWQFDFVSQFVRSFVRVLVSTFTIYIRNKRVNLSSLVIMTTYVKVTFSMKNANYFTITERKFSKFISLSIQHPLDCLGRKMESYLPQGRYRE